MKKRIITKGFIILFVIILMQFICNINNVVLGYDLININEVNISSLSDFTYSASNIEQDISIVHNGKNLVKGLDYIVTYKDNVNVGMASVIIQGIGSYTGSIEKNFFIKPKLIDEINVKVDTSDHRYKATNRNATVKMNYNNETLQLNKDYTLVYKDNIDVGTASVCIEGKGNYQGTIIKYYKIIPQKLSNLKIQVDTSNHTYTGKDRKASVKVYYNDKRLKLDKDYILSYKNTVKTGTAQVTIKGIGNYTGTKKEKYKIVPKKAIIKSVIMNSKNTQATVTWNKDSQASGYVIYMATSKNGEYKKVKNVSDKNKTKYTVKKLDSRKGYYFKVRSYKMFGDKKGYSKKYSDAKTNTGLLAKVELKATSSSKSRNTNLKMASKAINGMILKPGEIFNWFKVVGPATTAKGYKSATVFVDKKPVPGVGGGICQVSTTLYQAAKKAGLKMVERHTHSLPVTYTTKGNDATVAYGVKNLRIKNIKEYSIKIVTTSEGNKTICKIYRVN